MSEPDFGHGLVGALRETWREWRDDGATRHGAALAFYALFAVAPLLLLVTRIGGSVLGEQAAEAELAGQLHVLMPPDVANTVQDLVHGVSDEVTHWSTAVGAVVAATWGGLRGFLHLQGTLNQIWEVAPTRGPGIAEIVRRKLIAFSSVAMTGGLLVATLTFAMFLSQAYNRAVDTPENFWVVWALHEATAFALCFACVAVVYRVLPDVHIAWRDVFIGGLVTALLLTVGRQIVVFWLGGGHVGTSYGAAGHVVGLLLFVYYSANTLIFGAKLTHILALRRGAPILPSVHAVRVKRERLHE